MEQWLETRAISTSRLLCCQRYPAFPQNELSGRLVLPLVLMLLLDVPLMGLLGGGDVPPMRPLGGRDVLSVGLQGDGDVQPMGLLGASQLGWDRRELTEPKTYVMGSVNIRPLGNPFPACCLL